MSRSEALVSIVIPTYNVAQYVEEAVESVVGQTYPQLELIVVDDGSTDGTRERLWRFADRIVYVRQEHQGIGAARNTGVACARGALLGFLDADDLFLPDKVARQVRVLVEECAVDMVFGHVEEFYADDLPADERRRLLLREGTRPGYLAQTMLVRRSAFDRVGPFARWRAGEFVDWYARAIEAGLQPHMLPDVVTRRRLHRTNVGTVERGGRVEYARVLKAAMDRRRSAASGSEADPHQ